MAQVQLQHRFDNPQAYDCTPSSLLASNPCIACLSEKEMLAVLAGLLAIYNGDSMTDLITNSACFTCMSKKEMLQSLITIAGNELLGDSTTPQEVIDEMHCLVCASEKQLMAAILYSLCKLDITPV